MAIRKLEKRDWKGFLDGVTELLLGKRADIEVASLALGDQIETKSVQVLGMVYDHKDDVIEIVLDGLDHLIHRPRDLYVDQNGLELSSVQIVDAEGTRQIVMLRDPLMLPPPDEPPSDGGRSAR
jgi:hypothetical protein